MSELQCFLWAVDDHIMRWFDVSDAAGKKYGAIRPTGDFDGNFDYGRGIMLLHIVTTINHKFPPKRQSHKEEYADTYQTRMYLTNVDDGIWDAFSPEFKTMEEADALTDKVYAAYLEFEKERGKSLPTEKELNNFLMPLAMWGINTG